MASRGGATPAYFAATDATRDTTVMTEITPDDLTGTTTVETKTTPNDLTDTTTVMTKITPDDLTDTTTVETKTTPDELTDTHTVSTIATRADITSTNTLTFTHNPSSPSPLFLGHLPGDAWSVSGGVYVGGEHRVPAVTRNGLKLLLDKIENP